MTEETLGKRIVSHRRQLGLTQDGLAEKLGVTAQAVSKWENDQSSPDISMLPKLSEIFGITIDELLGVEKKQLIDAPVPAGPMPENVPCENTHSKRLGIGIALWLLMAGGILMGKEILPPGFYQPSFWEIIGLTGLLVFGLFGLYPRLSMFRLGCAMAGGYYLYCAVCSPAVQLNQELLVPILLLFFGLSLLVDSIRGKGIPVGHLGIDAAGKDIFEYKGNTFQCSTFFGEDHRVVSLPVLEGGEGNVIFGELSIDLHDCGNVSDGCCIALKCAFGSLTLFVPRKWRLQCANKTVCGTVREYGSAGTDAEETLRLENDVAFGEISIKYI